MSAGGRRFSVQVPDWGQDHLSAEAVAAYVDGELARAPVRPCHAPPRGVPRNAPPQVVAQGQARAALRSARCPSLPSSLMSTLRSIPQSRPSCPRCRPVSASPRTGSSSCCATSRGPIPVRAPGCTSTTCTPPPAPAFPRRAWVPAGRGAAPVLPPGADRRGVGPRAGRAGRRRVGRPGWCAGARGPERSPRWRRPGGATPARARRRGTSPRSPPRRTPRRPTPWRPRRSSTRTCATG